MDGIHSNGMTVEEMKSGKESMMKSTMTKVFRKVSQLLLLVSVVLFVQQAPAGEYRKGEVVNVGGVDRTVDLIDVSIKLPRSFTLQDVNDWKGVFEEGSRRIWNFTEKQSALGTVLVYRKKAPPQDDYDVMVEEGESYTDNPGARAYVNGLDHTEPEYKLFMPQSGWGSDGATLAHEFGHLAFDLGDDYKVYIRRDTDNLFLYREARDKDGNVIRPSGWHSLRAGHYADSWSLNSTIDSINALSPTGDETNPGNPFRGAPATIMCYQVGNFEVSTPDNHFQPWTGTVTEGGNTHDVTFIIHQHDLHEESAWETMSQTQNRQSRGLTIPATLINNSPQYATEWPPLKWILVDPKVTAIVLLDRSGSMGTDLMRLAIEGGESAISVSGIRNDADDFPGDFVGAASYSDTASINAAIEEMVQEATQRAQVAKIQNITASGMTAIGRGLRRCLDMFIAENTATPAPGVQEVIYLLTDGVHNTGEHPEGAILDELRARGVTIHTVALGPGADSAMMRRIAGTTGRTETIQDPTEGVGRLRAWFSEIATAAREASELATIEGVVESDMMEHSVAVDPFGDLEIVFNLMWDVGDLELNLVKPDGTVIDASAMQADPMISTLVIGRSHIVRVFRPEPGVWTVRVVPPAGQMDPQIYQVNVSSIGENDVYLHLAAPANELTHPSPLIISARFLGPFAGVKGAEVTGVVYRPDGSTVPFTLYDDGDPAHGDEYAGDGVYANRFTAFTVDGEYRFVMTGFNINGVTVVPGDHPDFVQSDWGPPVEPDPVAPFSRQQTITVYYDGIPEFINATPYTTADFASWELDRNTGAMVGSLVVQNKPDSHKTLIEPFWYAVTDTHNVMLAPYQTDGITDDGDPYVDITDKVNAALQAKYGRQSMEPGESVTIDGIAIYSRDRSVPDMRAVWSLWADPPGMDERRVDNFDVNADGVLGDSEILLAVEHWYANDMPDFDLLRRIELWKSGPNPLGAD